MRITVKELSLWLQSWIPDRELRLDGHVLVAMDGAGGELGRFGLCETADCADLLYPEERQLLVGIRREIACADTSALLRIIDRLAPKPEPKICEHKNRFCGFVPERWPEIIVICAECGTRWKIGDQIIPPSIAQSVEEKL